jgi:hypothetical protein
VGGGGVAVEEILEAIAELADDGFCRQRELIPRFRGTGERALKRRIGAAIRCGLVLERRGPDGQIYLALSSEGWRQLHSPSAA